MAVKGKVKAITVHRIETRANGKKKIIEPGTELSLTEKEADQYGPAVRRAKEETPEAEPAGDSTGSGEGSGDETGA